MQVTQGFAVVSHLFTRHYPGTGRQRQACHRTRHLLAKWGGAEGKIHLGGRGRRLWFGRAALPTGLIDAASYAKDELNSGVLQSRQDNVKVF